MTSQPPAAGGKALRTIAIVLFAAAVAVNLLGGIGTSCVAINPTGWGESMAKLAPFQWLYVALMIGAIAAAAWGIAVTVGLARGRQDAYRDALGVLLLSGILAGIQTYASIALRGKGAPQNMRFYLTVLVLVIFLLLRLPPIWRLIDGFMGGGRGNWRTPTGLAAFVGGLIVLTTPLWATPTHIGPDGANWVNVLRTPLLAGGALLTLAGVGLLRHARRGARPLRASQAAESQA
ncbi:MAG: hypothetical protein BWY52_01764 [Chloroflexi bacterium ADurb.Bin325]|nr:MAG: hypothetical protein BWY52_01764 [Chloroflexi bacterium ADurb.Bin325]